MNKFKMKQILSFVLIFIFFGCKDEKCNHKEYFYAGQTISRYIHEIP
jgi:hypothetical protein